VRFDKDYRVRRAVSGSKAFDRVGIRPKLAHEISRALRKELFQPRAGRHIIRQDWRIS
jgi:hypothetical protein